MSKARTSGKRRRTIPTNRAFLSHMTMGSNSHVRVVRLRRLLCLRTKNSCIAVFAPSNRCIGRRAVGCFRARLPPTLFIQVRHSYVIGARRVLQIRLFKGRGCRIHLGGKIYLQTDGTNCGLLGRHLSLWREKVRVLVLTRFSAVIWDFTLYGAFCYGTLPSLACVIYGELSGQS